MSAFGGSAFRRQRQHEFVLIINCLMVVLASPKQLGKRWGSSQEARPCVLLALATDPTGIGQTRTCSGPSRQGLSRLWRWSRAVPATAHKIDGAAFSFVKKFKLSMTLARQHARLSDKLDC